MVVEQVMAVHAGGTTDARLAPTPGPNLFYQIGTYLYQLAIRLCHQITQGAKELWGSGSQYRSMRYRTDAALLAMPDGWPMHQPYRCRAVGHASRLANDARYESQTYIQ